MIQVERFDAELKPVWDDLVRRAVNGHFMFERDFMEYHADRFDDHSLVFRDGTRPIAVLPAHREGDDLVSHQGLPFAGLIWTEKARLRSMHEIIGALVAYLSDHGFLRLVYCAMPAPYKRHHGDDDIYPLERAGAVVVRTRVASSVRIDDSPGISRKRRQILQQAAHHGIRIEQGIPVSDCHELITRFLEERFQTRPVHTASELQLLAARFPEQIRCAGAFHGDSLVHTMVTFHSRTCIRLQYSAGTRPGRELYAADLMISSLIQELSKQGGWIDFGTSMDPRTGDLDPGLHAFKESFGGRTSLLRTYQLGLQKG